MATLEQHDEVARLEQLAEYGILDTPPDELFDDFTRLAAQICEVPISLISLVDEHRQWFKSKVGLEVDETPRTQAFCAHALPHPHELLVVQDALQDERFAHNPLVTGEPHIRSYAGAPLVTAQGHALGTLCVIDKRPRELSEQQLSALRTLARQVVAQLDARLNLIQLNSVASELEKQQYETQLILDNVPAYVFFKDTENNILRVNQPVTEALNKPASEIEGHPTAEFYPDLADDFYKDDLEVIHSKRPKLGIVERLNADARGLRWIRTDKIPVANDDGEIERLLVLALDITDLKNTEDSLRESQEELSRINASLEERVRQQTAELAELQAMYEDLYQNAPDLHVSVDPNDGVVLKCNETLLTEMGYDRDEIVGKPVLDLYHPSSIESAKLALDEFRKTGEVRNHELVLARKDGTPVNVSLNVSSVRDEDGNIVASRSVWRDITEKKRLETEIQRNVDRLAHLSRIATINEMATGIAHELNQPLQAIVNYAQGAIIRLKREVVDPALLETLFADIAADADRAAKLILSFRRFSKPSAKESVQIAPAELVERLKRLIVRELDNCGSQLKIDLAERLPYIKCDSVQIKQVLLNLIINARDAIASSGAENQTIKLVVQPGNGDHVRFSVIDRGTGATEVEIDKMFDAFYTTKESGLGMGLAICKTIVETHGGELVAQANDDGPGLTMSFELPISNA